MTQAATASTAPVGPDVHSRFTQALRTSTVALLLGSMLFYAYSSIHWAIQSDSAVMHYVRLLLDHGLKPYSDISDNNMPGAYLTEGWGMRVFGYSDVGWRFYDFFLVAVMTAAMVVLARPYDWVAGVYAAGMFTVMHGAEGPLYSVEREQVILVLLVVGYAVLFTAVRRRAPLFAGVFGLAGGVIASIKPQYGLLVLFLLAFATAVLRRRKVRWLPYAAWGIAGIATVAAINVGFLLYHHALRGFWFVLRVITPSYVGTGRPSFLRMLQLLSIRSVLLLLLAAILLAASSWSAGNGGRSEISEPAPGRSWEWWAVVLGAAFGLFSFFLQGKGYVHHRYIFLALLFLLLGLEFMAALRRPGWRRWLAAVAVFGSLLLAPRTLIGMRRQVPTNVFAVQLEKDLTALGGQTGGVPSLEGKVQCFDITDGCLEALYHLRLAGNTGFTGDLLLFSDTRAFAVDFYRDEFWDLARNDPAEVIVLSNQWFQHDNSFAKIDRWPPFAVYLRANYTLVGARAFSSGAVLSAPIVDGGGPDAYRIYVRNGSPLAKAP